MKMNNAPSQKRRNQWLIATSLALIVLGIIQIADTYSVLSHTWDEPAHIAAGMQLLDLGEYQYELQHPPLGRLATAVIPYLTGVHSFGEQSMWDEGLRLLYDSGSYESTLTRARLGILPFFVFLVVLTWYWSKRYSGLLAATLTSLFLLTQPTILAHAGLATTDMPMVAMSFWSLLSFILWLEKPIFIHSAILGISTGLAFMSKFSAIPFLAVSFLAVILYRWVTDSPVQKSAISAVPVFLPQVLISLIFLFISAWAVFGFSWSDYPQTTTAEVTEESPTLSLPTVLTATIGGIKQVAEHNDRGHYSYLLGEWRQKGWWYFFLIAVPVKSTIPLLICAAIGFATALRKGSQDHNWQSATPGIIVLSILIFSTISNINIGVRHVLLIFPLLAIQAAYGVQWMLVQTKQVWPARAIVIILLIWQGMTTLLAHPDYLPWFNALAGSQPENILIESDLDWGQDLNQLSVELQGRNIKRVAIAYNGLARMDQHNLPPNFKLEPGQPVTGWVAISLRSRESKEGYHWLKAFQPEARIGHSIDLYFIKLSDLSVADRAKAKMTEALSVRYSLGDTKQAIELFKEVLTINSQHYGALWQIASAQQDLGRTALAISAWNAVMSEAQRTQYAAGVAETKLKLNYLQQVKLKQP